MFFEWDLSVLNATLLGLVTSLVIYYVYRSQFNHYWKRYGIPSDSPNLVFGTLFYMMKGIVVSEIDQTLYKKYGRIFGAYEGMCPIMYISDPDHLKMIFVKDFANFTNTKDLNFNDKIMDCMLSVTKDEQWKRLRTIITPTFTTGKIKGMTTNIEQCAIQSTRNFVQKAESGEIAECKNLFGNFTLDVIARVAFGTQLNSHNDPNNVFVTNVKTLFNKDVTLKSIFVFTMPKLAKLFGISFFNASFFVDLTKSIIERRRQTKEVRHDFLQMLIECLEEDNDDKKDWKQNGNDLNEDSKLHQKKTLSTDELIAQCVLFFLAGYDTTATTLSMICYNLALNKEIQKNLLKEIDGIWKKHPEMDASALHEAHYLEAVINETLRLFPPGLRLWRTAKEDYILGSTGIVVPKGTLVTVPIYSIHRDSEFFPNPDEFKPERFLPENIDSINKFTYFPFGSGPRNCVAKRFALMEIKISLMYLLKEVEFDVCSDTKIPLEFYNGIPVLQPRSVELKVTRRTKA